MNKNQHRWVIHQTRQVEKVLSKLPEDLLERIDKAIWDLAQNPYPPGCTKMRGTKYGNLYRIRLGGWRISYAVEEKDLIILILEVAPRGQAYRHL